MANTKIYIIDNTDSSESFAIQPRTFDGTGGVQSNTDITLYGNAAPDWGERFNENFYQLLENFACSEKATLPGVPQDENDIGISGRGVNRPIRGQLWYNKSNDQMYVFDGTDWSVLGGVGSIEDIPGLRTELDGKVNRIGDTMTGTLNIVSTTYNFMGLNVESPSAPYIQVRASTTGSVAPGIVLYNADNDPTAGGISGNDGYARIVQRDGDVIQIERASNGGLASGTGTLVLRIEQEPGSISDGEMFFMGGGSGAYNGDIRIPNASITRVDHVASKGYVDGQIALIGGGGSGVTSVNGDTGPAVTLTASDFSDIYSKTEVDGLISGVGSGVTSVNGDTGPAVTITASDITDVYSQTQVDNRIAAANAVYVSPQFTSSNGVLRSAAHGLGGIPDIVQLEAVCVVSEHGYSVGECVILNPTISDRDEGSVSGNHSSNLLSVTSTTVYFAIANEDGANNLYMSSKTTPGIFATGSLGNWNIRVRCVKFT